MSALPTSAAPPYLPDPHQDRAVAGADAVASDGADAPGRTGCLISLLRKLIDFGKQLAGTPQQCAAAANLAAVAARLGTVDIALILARIARGLRLAAALETRLVSRPLPETRPAAAVTPPPRPPPNRRPGVPGRPATRVSLSCQRRRKSRPTSAAARRTAPPVNPFPTFPP